MADRYFLWFDNRPEREVSREEYVRAENRTAWRFTHPARPATEPFFGQFESGRIEAES